MYLDSLPDDADLVRVDVVSRPAPPLGSAVVGTAPLQLARPRPAARRIPGSDEEIERILDQKPAHWRGLWDGKWINAEGGPGSYRPQKVSHDSIREITAMVHIMNEMIDEACGRVLDRVAARGWDNDTDVFFTTDHGELQGDYGLIFKGPFHTDSLMRLPFVWRPAPSAGCERGGCRTNRSAISTSRRRSAYIAGVEQPDWMQGEPLPTAPGNDRERASCEWDSQMPGYGMHLRTIYRDGWLCTAYEKSTIGEPNGLEDFFTSTGMFGGGIGPISKIAYDGTEGELLQRRRGPAPVGEPLGRSRVQGDQGRPRRRPLRPPAEGTQGLKVVTPA